METQNINRIIREFNQKSEKFTRAEIDRSKPFRHKDQFRFLEGYLRERFQESRPAHYLRKLGLKSRPSPVEILEIGVGHLEETFSTAVVAHQVAEETGIHIDDLINIQIVDLKSKEELRPVISFGKYKLSFPCIRPVCVTNIDGNLYGPNEPPFTIKEKYPSAVQLENGEYRYNDAIIQSVHKIVEQGEFETKVQDFINRNEKQYDMVLCNNVLQYLRDDQEREETVHKLITALKPAGVISVHFPDTLQDSKDRGGPKKLIGENPRFSYLEQINDAMYRRIEQQ